VWVRAKDKPPARTLKAIHGLAAVPPDPDHEIGLSERLKKEYGREGLIELYARFTTGDGVLDTMMRRVIWRAIARRFGHGVTIRSGAGFLHLETFEIGNGVFIGAQAYLQGRFDGRCIIGDRTWIGPQAYLDARDLVLGESVGWGPGAKVLGSEHTGLPADIAVIRTDLDLRPVRVEDWADVGTNSTLLPGVTLGKGSIVGAGAVVIEDVAPFAIVGGVPARFLKWRKGSGPLRETT
jgi:acetyltransferase-like isoleucine patch superfamily enzyme